MQSLDGILQQLTERTGTEAVPMSEEERVKFLCDCFNKRSEESKDGYDCPKCKNKLMIAVPKEREYGWEEVHRVCSCIDIRKTLKRLERSGLQGVFNKNTFDKYRVEHEWQRVLKEKAVAYAAKPDGAWFFIGGQSGCGKSHLCTAIAGELLKSGKAVQYMLWIQDADTLKGCVLDAEKHGEMMERLKKVEVLYVDDLFKTGNDANGRPLPPTAADIKIAFDILNYRSLNPRLITIISSERSIYDLIGIDQALGGRINEMTFDKGHGLNIKPDKAKNYRLRNIVSI